MVNEILGANIRKYRLAFNWTQEKLADILCVSHQVISKWENGIAAPDIAILCSLTRIFQRQKTIGNYIVDFYYAKARLVVELDGGGHYTPEQIEKDKVRTKELEGMNLIILRICNLDIDRNFSGVCEYIDLNVKKSLPQSASLTAPSSEEVCYIFLKSC